MVRRHCFLPMQMLASRRHIHHNQSVCHAMKEIRARLCRTPNSSNDAKALVANALQLPLASSNDVYFTDEHKLTRHEAAALHSNVERRLKGEPLAYITGRKEFWSLELNVSKDVLIPRSDSEVLIETLVDQYSPETPLQILDIGTGSGCLLLSALSEFPHATGVGIDICPRALAVAKQNALLTNLAARADFVLRDVSTLSRLQNEVTANKTLYRRFDVVLCNPPYIPRRELDQVEPDVLKYEPHLALFADGGPDGGDSRVDLDGLRMYRMLYESANKLFHSNARRRKSLLVEIGSEAQAQAVRTLFSSDLIPKSVQVARITGLQLQFERFLFDACGNHRGILFLAP